MKEQGELFDGFVRLRKCRKCKRKLHVDPNNNYQTREAGLCFACLRDFNASGHWTVDRFCEDPVDAETQLAVDEFIANAREFLSLLNSAQIMAIQTKVFPNVYPQKAEPSEATGGEQG